MSVHLEDIFDTMTTEDSISRDPKCCFCFPSSYNRFVALIFIIIAAFFYSADYDMPGSMINVVESTFSILPYEFEYLYSVYAMPNVVMCFFSGLLIDKVIGLLYGAIVFNAIALTGQIIITVGGFTRYYSLMLIGRFINGIGAESVSLCLNCFAVLWFKNKELNFVFGVFTSITRLGSSFAFLIFAPLYKHVRSVFQNNLSLGVSILPFLAMTVAMVASVIILGYFSRWNNKSVSKSQSSENVIQFKNILQLPFIYWLILIMLALCNNVVFGFISISQLFLQSKYDLRLEEADYVISAFNLISALVSPVPGLIVDKLGKSLYFNMIGLVLGAISQIIMCTTSWNLWIPLVIFSLYFSILNSCGWPLIARVVEPFQLATAYGMLQCFINLFATVYNILVGLFMEKYGPTGISLLSLCTIAIGIICCLSVWLLDHRSKGILNYPSTQQRSLP